MYKKLLILLFVCSSAFAVEFGNEPVINEGKEGLPFPLLWGMGLSDAQPFIAFAGGPGNEGGECAYLAQEVVQERTIFGVQCPQCTLPLEADSEGELTEEVRRHLWVGHKILATGNEVQGLLDGKQFITGDTIFFR